ncbi:MAG TPA: VWA domain-containing protein [Caldisericia bacterium]|nr:VWA domain-containing protein [Caldisericia bacterium]
MKKFIVILSLLIILISFSFLSYANSQVPPNVVIDNYQVSIGDIDYKFFPNIKLIVSVIDKDGKPVTNLTKKDFSIYENNEKRKITRVNFLGTKPKPLSVLLVLDRSSSMVNEPIKKLKEAANYFVDLIPNEWKIGVISFGTNVTYDVGFTNDKNLIKEKINSIQSGGNTPLYKTIINSIDYIKNDINRGAIILFTDGVNDEQIASATKEDTINAANNSIVPIYTIGYVSEEHYKEIGGIDEPFLKQISDITRGRFYKLPSFNEIKEIYESISKILSSQYEIFYVSKLPLDYKDKINTEIVYKNPTTSELIGGNKTFYISLIAKGGNMGVTIEEFLKELGISWVLSLSWWFSWGVIIGLVIILGSMFLVIFDILKRGEKQKLWLHLILFIIYSIFPIIFLIFRFNLGFASNLGLYLFILIASLIAPIIAVLHLIFYFTIGKKEVSSFMYEKIGDETETAAIQSQTGETTEALEGLAGEELAVDKTISIKKKKLPAIAWLVMMEGEREGEDFRITKEEFKIGRDPSLKCDLVLKDPTVSKEHAKIKLQDDGKIYIYDLGSENGTIVNDEEIKGPKELKDGDIIVIGKTKFLFKLAQVNKGKNEK